MKPFPAALLLALSALAVSACSLTPYRIDVRQGNMVTQEMVSQLRPGMSKDQVRFVLGTPLVTDVFHADRWDYVYRLQPGRGETQQRVLTVFFADGQLSRVAGDVVAASAAESEQDSPSLGATPDPVVDTGPAQGEANPPPETPARNP